MLIFQLTFNKEGGLLKCIYIKKIFREYWNPDVTIGIASNIIAFYFGITDTVWTVKGNSLDMVGTSYSGSE
jgi:hypothetical protein